MKRLQELLAGIAPALATAVVGPAGGAIVSMLAKQFGVPEDTEAVATAITADPAAAIKLKELELEYARLAVANTDGARGMQTAALQQEGRFAKNFVYLLATFWSLVAVIYVACITFIALPPGNVRFADTILGFLLGTVVATILNFFFGSSLGSKKKQSALEDALK